MPHSAVSLSMMYQEHVFLDRFAIVAKSGFEGVESLFSHDFDRVDIRARLDGTGLTQVLFSVPPGDWAGGECDIASLPGREEKFKRDIATAFEYAQVLGNTRLHMIAGLPSTGADRARHYTIYASNVAYAAREAAGAGVIIVLGPINVRDMLGFFLIHQAQAHAMCREVGVVNVKVQSDLYHAQIMEDDLLVKLKQYVDGVGHVQIAGVSDHHELDEGELHYPHFFALLDALGYNGWVGREYRPRAGTSERLGWLRRWRENQR